jgi:hypothetical protein
MEVKVFHNPDARPEEWRVEVFDDDGACDVVLFSGPHAEEWARLFAGDVA